MKARWVLSIAAGLCLHAAAAREFEIRVEPSDAGYQRAIIAAPAPDGFPDAGVLTSGDEQIPFQKGVDGYVTFIASGLEPGVQKTWSVSDGLGSRENIRTRLKDGSIRISAGGKEIFHYQGEETEFPRPGIDPLYKRGGYLHPVFSTSGKVVTDDYPSNHIHHHGIWFPWTKTSFEGREPDFWNMGQGKGKVEFVAFGNRWSGPVHAGFEAKHRFVDLTSGEPRAALNETWNVTAYHIPGADYFVFDLVSTQICATASPLKLPEYYYGGLGFRGNWAWNGKENCFFLTSNGETNKVTANGTRANWCHISGEVDGALTGIAILGHPENFRAPQPMRLHPTEPFFCFAPSQLGDWAIEPGKPYVSRYRFIVLDGPPDKKELDALWSAYARPPKIKIVQK